jgi:hypothetical protein
MTEEIIYLYSSFVNGFDAYQLYKEVSNTLNVPCRHVVVQDDDVYIGFDVPLTIDEDTALDTVVANHVVSVVTPDPNEKLFMPSPMDCICVHLCTGEIIEPLTETKIINWTLNEGLLEGFDQGEFTFPVPGIYLYNVFIESLDSNGNTEIDIKIKDDTGTLLVAKTQTLKKSGATYAFIATGGFYTNGSSVFFTVQVDLAQIVLDCEFKMIRLFKSV